MVAYKSLREKIQQGFCTKRARERQRQTDRQTDKQKDTGRQTDRQTEIKPWGVHVNMKRCILEANFEDRGW